MPAPPIGTFAREALETRLGKGFRGTDIWRGHVVRDTLRDLGLRNRLARPAHSAQPPRTRVCIAARRPA